MVGVAGFEPATYLLSVATGYKSVALPAELHSQGTWACSSVFVETSFLHLVSIYFRCKCSIVPWNFLESKPINYYVPFLK